MIELPGTGSRVLLVDIGTDNWLESSNVCRKPNPLGIRICWKIGMQILLKHTLTSNHYSLSTLQHAPWSKIQSMTISGSLAWFAYPIVTDMIPLKIQIVCVFEKQILQSSILSVCISASYIHKVPSDQTPNKFECKPWGSNLLALKKQWQLRQGQERSTLVMTKGNRTSKRID